jgi:hypothetical protein
MVITVGSITVEVYLVGWMQVCFLGHDTVLMPVSQVIMYGNHLSSTVASLLRMIKRKAVDICKLQRLDKGSFRFPNVLYFRSSREICKRV